MADWGGHVELPETQVLTVKKSNFDVPYSSMGYLVGFQLFGGLK